jgi:hypothetical protein
MNTNEALNRMSKMISELGFRPEDIEAIAVFAEAVQKNTPAAHVAPNGEALRAAYVEGAMEAREFYGTLDGETDTPHGAECDRVQGPYVCTCNEEYQSEEFMSRAKYLYPVVDND